MDRVFDLVAVAGADHLGGKKQLQPGDPNGVGHDAIEASASGLGLSFGHAVLSDHFHVAPDVVGQHHDLEEGVVVFKFGRWEHVQAFALGLTDQVLDIGAFIVFGNQFWWAGPARDVQKIL